MVGVTKRYGDNVALNDVDLDIRPGEILGLLGPNGAGKTTLVSIAAGLLRADTGTVKVCGIDVRRDPVGARRRLGLAPQELGVYPLLSVRENLVFFGEMAGLRSHQLRRRGPRFGQIHRPKGTVPARGREPPSSHGHGIDSPTCPAFVGGADDGSGCSHPGPPDPGRPQAGGRGRRGVLVDSLPPRTGAPGRISAHSRTGSGSLLW